jgi:DNA polymerase III, alpha subunit (gram-positive type)
MIEHNVPDWYIDSCKKIKYMFPKAHAAAYVTDAIVIGWYKIYYPLEFYAAFFTAAPAGFDSEIVMKGPKNVVNEIKALEEKGIERTQKESSTLDTLLMVNEFYCRGLSFLPISIEKSSAKAYIPENGKVRLPFSSLPGLGDTAADKIIEARETNDIYSVEDLKFMAKLSKTVIDTLEKCGAFEGMSKTNQITMF